MIITYISDKCFYVTYIVLMCQQGLLWYLERGGGKEDHAPVLNGAHSAIGIRLAISHSHHLVYDVLDLRGDVMTRAEGYRRIGRALAGRMK